MMSNLGVMLWAATAAICGLTWSVLRQLADPRAVFFAASGCFSAWLGLDDLFMLHEDVLHGFVGLPQTAPLLLYAAAAAVYFLTFVRTIVRTSFALLGLALAGLGASMAVDLFMSMSERETALEDGAKLIGITHWLAYFAHTAQRALRTAIYRDSVESPAPATARITPASLNHENG